MRLHLDAGRAVQDDDAAVAGAQRLFHLHGEVDVAGRVQQIDAVCGAPVEADGRTADGDAALALLRQAIGDGGAVVHLAQLVRLAGVEEHALGGGGFAGIDVRQDADVANALLALLVGGWRDVGLDGGIRTTGDACRRRIIRYVERRSTEATKGAAEAAGVHVAIRLIYELQRVEHVRCIILYLYWICCD